MSDTIHLPTRAEFIRDRLAEWVESYGYSVSYGAKDNGGWPVLYVWGGLDDNQEMDLIIHPDGRFYDDTSERFVTFRGFTWPAEPTDTGV